MRVGVHLPQYGRAAGPEAIRRAARHAEDLGFADIWVSDHVVHPAALRYPSAHLYDPLLTLCWGAAATTTIGLGTSVMVAPLHPPLALANSLASLDALSAGRLTVAIGIGWSEAEFAALGQPFHDRGRRTDEIIELLRRCWTDDPVSFAGPTYPVDGIRVLPKPAHPIPLWVGGASEAAFVRACRLGDGFHAIGLHADTVGTVVARIRRDRPEERFPISLRTGWDPQGMEPDQIRTEHAAFAAAGVQHVVAAPWRSDLDAWLRSMDLLAQLIR